MHNFMQEKKYLDEKLKPHLQVIISAIELEERNKKNGDAIGDCVELFIQKKMLSELFGHAKNNRPNGILFLTLKFTTFLFMKVQSTEILDCADIHSSLF